MQFHNGGYYEVVFDCCQKNTTVSIKKNPEEDEKAIE